MLVSWRGRIQAVVFVCVCERERGVLLFSFSSTPVRIKLTLTQGSSKVPEPLMTFTEISTTDPRDHALTFSPHLE